MHRKLIAIVFLVVVFSFSACGFSNYYFTKGNEVFYFTDEDGLGEVTFKVEEVDTASFQILDDIYAKDGKNVYRVGKIIEGADPATFEVLSHKAYAKDRFAVYFWGKKVEGADPQTFVLIDPKHAKDAIHEYSF